MTDPESEFFQKLGLAYLRSLVQLSIYVFSYGASSSLVLPDSSTSSMTGVYVVLFAASVVIFMSVFSFLQFTYFVSRPDPSEFDRRRGFSNRATAAMFVATIINFLLCSLNVGNQIATIVVFIRDALILDVHYPFSKDRVLVNNALRKPNIVGLWASTLSVSIKLSLLDPLSIHVRWRYYSVISLSFGGRGSSSQIDSG